MRNFAEAKAQLGSFCFFCCTDRPGSLCGRSKLIKDVCNYAPSTTVPLQARIYKILVQPVPELFRKDTVSIFSGSVLSFHSAEG
jgi:hypothetical protein